MQTKSSLWVLMGLCLSVSTAEASPLLDLAGDMGSTAGQQARVVPGGSGAAYFNPALLIDATEGLTLGVAVLTQQIGISLDGRPGTQFAVPEGLENAGHADATRWDNYPLATNLLQNGRMKDALHEALSARPRQGASTGHRTHSYEVIGIVTKFFDERFAFGLHGLIPNGNFTEMQAFYNDEREQYFSNSLHPELYGDRMTSLSLGLGAGLALSDAFSLGVGATISLKAVVNAPTYVVDTGNLGKILIATKGQVETAVSPHFGLSWKATRRLRLIATAHAPEKLELATNFTFLLANGIEQASGITFVHDYTPWQLATGASLDLVQTRAETFRLSATVVYARWSSYLDRHGFEPTPAYAWGDTLAPSLGARYRWGRTTSFLDLLYQPTPVPPQTGRTNYVDNDRAGVSLGTEYQFTLWGTAMRIGGQAQAHWLVPRHQDKLPTPTFTDGEDRTPELVKDEVPDDSQISGMPLSGVSGLQTNNPGWPGFGSSGAVLGGSLYIGVTP